MTLNFCVVAVFVNIPSLATRNTQYAAMFMIRLSYHISHVYIQLFVIFRHIVYSENQNYQIFSGLNFVFFLTLNNEAYMIAAFHYTERKPHPCPLKFFSNNSSQTGQT